MTINSGRFIVIDGPRGVGKTTVTMLLGQRFAAAGFDILATAEPPADPFGSPRANAQQHFPAEAWMAHLAANRDRLLSTTIRPALAAGRTVVCDQYVPSSLITNYVAGAPGELIGQFNAQTDRPDLTIVLVPEEQMGVRRADQSSGTHPLGDGVAEAFAYRAIAALLIEAGWHTHLYDVGESAATEVADGVFTVIRRELSC